MSFTQTQSFGRFLVLLCFSLIITISSGATTISANQPLSGDYTIISEGEQFELGFFKAGNSANYYIGIWYKKIKSNPPTIVWVANRETPISDRFRSELKIIDRNLVLLNESKAQIWSTNVTTTTTTTLNSATAVILDNGNLVLRDSGSNSIEPFWQSFYHPTHTWLPGAKFGYDNRTKKNQVLTSWRSKDDPGVGFFSFELQPSSNDYHMNENESYFTYSVYNPSIISRNIMDVSGQLQQLTWLEATKEWNLFWSQPRKQCEVYALCGSFGICRQSGLHFCNCLTGFNPRSESEWNQSGFSSGVKNLPPNNSVAVGSAGECRTTCMNDCSCNAYSFVGTQCLVWDGDLLNLSEDDGSSNTIYIKVASKDLLHPKKSNPITASVIAWLVGGVILVLGLILGLFYVKKRVSVAKMEMVGSLVVFAYKDIKRATKNFSDKLGGGGFGSVFKGVLHDSSIVAVKKLESIRQGEKQFRSEVSTMGIIQHVHLVRLRGFCAEGNSKLLVYDYMEKGSLDTYLFCGKQVLNWETRYQIALGIARGLVYLHDKCRDCIIHCGIKPDNILLDANFQPKVADFGLAKLVGRDFSRVLTTTRGSMGYLAPEWISGVPVTAKADVYSYGMMLFKLVHGKRNVMHCEYSSSTFYPGLVSNVLMKGGDILSLLDSRLNREACVEEVTKIFKVACWCIQDEAESRPAMSLVEGILEGVSDHRATLRVVTPNQRAHHLKDNNGREK
ncbi:unnamed protein product [Lactuca saligna]|uniref:Receptor-like serine/threonine-protein kinase n=1 Tax=Lactuca saligna TaxID=75948 RepID=A0AA35YKJ2_LACSI|nr:unnamed protein product [Lactuca saligna]